MWHWGLVARFRARRFEVLVGNVWNLDKILRIMVLLLISMEEKDTFISDWVSSPISSCKVVVGWSLLTHNAPLMMGQINYYFYNDEDIVCSLFFNLVISPSSSCWTIGWSLSTHNSPLIMDWLSRLQRWRHCVLSLKHGITSPSSRCRMAVSWILLTVRNEKMI